MKKQAEILSSILAKNKKLLLLLLDQLIDRPVDKLPMTEEVADRFGVNVNTVKGVYAALAKEGYIESRRRSGTRSVASFSPEQVDAYQKAKDKIGSILQSLEFAGFNDLEMAACLMNSFSRHAAYDNGVLFTESDFNELLIGRQELEQELGIAVSPRYLDDLILQLKAGEVRARLIITTFYCEEMLKEFSPKIQIVPLRITPPLEQLLNFALLPRDTSILMVVVTDEIKRRYTAMYPNIVKDFPLFRMVTIKDVMHDKGLLHNVHILLTLKNLYREHTDLFAAIPKIVTYNRFQDQEGINHIKSLVAKPQEIKSAC